MGEIKAWDKKKTKKEKTITEIRKKNLIKNRKQVQISVISVRMITRFFSEE